MGFLFWKPTSSTFNVWSIITMDIYNLLKNSFRLHISCKMLIIRLAVFAAVKNFEYYSTVNMTSTYTLYILYRCKPEVNFRQCLYCSWIWTLIYHTKWGVEFSTCASMLMQKCFQFFRLKFLNLEFFVRTAQSFQYASIILPCEFKFRMSLFALFFNPKSHSYFPLSISACIFSDIFLCKNY